jgi:exoribonuclease R
MESMDSDARWQQMASLRDEVDRPAVVVPICVSRLDGLEHELSPRAMRFAEALSFTDGWSRISDARSRRAA